MKTKVTERTRVLNTINYELFVSPKEFKLNNAHLKTLIFEMAEKNLSKDLPIIVDENYNILDGKYRYEANKRLNAPIYYKVAEVGEFVDFMSAKDINRKLTVKDYAIMHKDKIDYRLLLDGINKLPFQFKEVAYYLCNVDTRSRANWKDFKSGEFEFKKEYQYKIDFIHWVVTEFNSRFKTQYNLRFKDAFYLADSQVYSWVKESVNNDLNDPTGYISKFFKVIEIGYPTSSTLKDVLGEIWYLQNDLETVNSGEYSFVHIETLKLIDKILA